MEYIILAASGYGLYLFINRSWPQNTHIEEYASEKKISIIIPHESGSIASLLESLFEIDYPQYEAVVVTTACNPIDPKLADRPNTKVHICKDAPAGWQQRQWLCAEGAAQATGDLLLFSDKDVRFFPDTICKAVTYLETTDADLLSATPYFIEQKLWQKMLGPFYLLTSILGSSLQSPEKNPVLATRRFLLFRKDAYHACGGHKSVRGAISEERSLTSNILSNHLSYRVYPAPKLFAQIGEKSFKTFLDEWRQQLDHGPVRLKNRGIAESAACFLALSCLYAYSLPLLWLVGLLTFIVVTSKQRMLGRFSPLGPILWPVSVGVFLAAVAKSGFFRLRSNQGARWAQRLILKRVQKRS